MAFPQVVDADTQHGVVTSNSTTWVLTYPTNLADGDLILLMMASDGAQAVGPGLPAGWVSFTVNNVAVSFVGAKKRSDGTESGNFNATGLANEQGAWRVYRITGWGGTLGTSFGISDSNTGDVERLQSTGSSLNPDPPNLNPINWDVEDTLWIAAAAVDTSRTFSGFPSSYTNTESEASGGAGGASLGVARRENAVSAENPGTFTISTSDDWACVTIAIRPVAAGGATITLTDSATAADVRRMDTVRTLSDAATAADTVQKASTRALSDSATAADVRLNAMGKTVLESVAASDSRRMDVAIVLTDSVTGLDSRKMDTARSLSDGVTAADSIAAAKFRELVLTDSATAADHISKGWSMGGWNFEGPTAQDLPLEIAITRALPEVATAADSLATSRFRGITLSESVTATDARQLAVARLLSDSVTATDTQREDVSRILSDAVTAIDTVEPIKSGGGTAYTKDLTEAVTIGDVRQMAVVRTLVDAVTPADVRQMATTRALADSVTAADLRQMAMVRVLSDGVSAADTVSTAGSGYHLVLLDAAAAADSRQMATALVLSDAAAATDTRRMAYGKTLTETATATGVLAFPGSAYHKELLETVTAAAQVFTAGGQVTGIFGKLMAPALLNYCTLVT